MNVTIINDCRDDNAKNRQIARTASLLNCNVSFVGVKDDVEASGNIIDTFDALCDSEGIVIVNVAPRNGKSRQWENGTPFAYFWYKNILCLASVEGHTLSLVKKLGLVKSVRIFDIKQSLLEAGYSDKIAEHAARSQFRSFDFLPRIAGYVFTNKSCTGEEYSLDEVASVEAEIWWTDNFGNCKTTLLQSDLEIENDQVELFGKTLPFYEQLKDVRDDELAAVRGSSGLEDNRFVEIMKQGGRACDNI